MILAWAQDACEAGTVTFFQAVVKALWIIGNFISNELKGSASARTFPAKWAGEDQLPTWGRGMNLCLSFKFLQATTRMRIIITASHSPSCRLEARLCVLGVRRRFSMEWKKMISEGSVLGPGKMSWTPSGSPGSNALSSWKPLVGGHYASLPSHRKRTAYFTSVLIATPSCPCPCTQIPNPWVLAILPASCGCVPVPTLTFSAEGSGHTT